MEHFYTIEEISKETWPKYRIQERGDGKYLVQQGWYQWINPYDLLGEARYLVLWTTKYETWSFRRAERKARRKLKEWEYYRKEQKLKATETTVWGPKP